MVGESMVEEELEEEEEKELETAALTKTSVVSTRTTASPSLPHKLGVLHKGAGDPPRFFSSGRS